ncbi:MAG: STAS domain-containing protein [Phycisphaerae bacterium]|nr:STAS domain-containing protein [Phycisphaerae bacterium]
MFLNVEKHGGVVIVSLQEPCLDATNYQDAIANITPMFRENCKVILDITEVQYVDSTGLTAFTSCHNKCQDANGRLRICCASGAVEEVLELVHMDRLIPIFDTQQRAIHSFAEG